MIYLVKSEMDYISSDMLSIKSVSTPESWHPRLDMLEEKATSSAQSCLTTISDFSLIGTKPSALFVLPHSFCGRLVLDIL